MKVYSFLFLNFVSQATVFYIGLVARKPYNNAN